MDEKCCRCVTFVDTVDSEGRRRRSVSMFCRSPNPSDALSCALPFLVCLTLAIRSTKPTWPQSISRDAMCTTATPELLSHTTALVSRNPLFGAAWKSHADDDALLWLILRNVFRCTTCQPRVDGRGFCTMDSKDGCLMRHSPPHFAIRRYHWTALARHN